MTRMRVVTVPAVADGWESVVEGTVLQSLMPSTKGLVVLRLNGQYLLRKDWPETVEADDQVEWILDLPEGKEDIRTLLQVAAVVAAFATAGGASPYLSVAFAAVNVAYNLLVPPSVRDPDAEGAPKYNAALSGNQARLDQPIWRICGVDRINPPFAGQPYLEFDANGDQYFYCVFSLGYGPVDLLAEFIGKTPIGNFSDVITHSYLSPGTQPSIALANVITSREVTSLDLLPGRYAGGYVVCQPARTVKSIGYDIIAPEGLGKLTDEDDDAGLITVTWQSEYREIDDAGRALNDWQVLDTGSKSLHTNTVQRWSQKTDLPYPMRCEWRVFRSNVVDTDPSARDKIALVGLRGYLNEPVPLNVDSSHYEVVMRASQQLSAQSQSDFNVIAQGKCRTWAPDGGGTWSCASKDFGDYSASRNPAWWLADLWTDPTWGEGLPDERIDLQTLYDLSLVWEARQDRFDYTFADRTDAWTASQLIAGSGRGRVFRRYGVRTLARDELAEIGETAFTPRICIGEMVVNETFPRATDPDGWVVEYVSNRTWEIDTVDCPCPGVVLMERPIYQRLDGIKGRTHALREGLYHAADMALRQRTVQFKTEMEAVSASFMLPVRWQPLIPGYGQTGDVAFWDVDTLVMGLSEQPNFDAGDIYLTLKRDDGTLTTPVRVFPGPTAWDIVLPEAPDFDLVLTDGLRERPMFLLGTLAGDELVKVSAITDGGQSDKGAQYFNIEAVVDDARVHQADNPYLPGPDEIQDPIGVPNDDGGGGIALVVNLTARDAGGADAYASAFNSGAGPELATFDFQNDGAVLRTAHSDGNKFLEQMWMTFGLIETSVAALYEIKFVYRPDVYPYNFYRIHSYAFGSVNQMPQIGTFDTWLSLDTTRSISLRADPGLGDGPALIAPVQVDIRKIGASASAATGIFVLHAQYLGTGGGA